MSSTVTSTKNHIMTKHTNIYIKKYHRWRITNDIKDRRGRDHMVVGFTTAFAISAYHYWCCELESRSGRGVQQYVITFVSDMRQVDGFLRVLRFPPPIKLTNKQMTLIKYPILLYWYFVLIHSYIFWLWDSMFPLLVDLRACYLCKNCYEIRSYIAAGQH